MEDTEDLFIPDYTHRAQSGVISDHNSILQCKSSHIYVSIDNIVNQIGSKTLEIENTFGGYKRQVTAFLVGSESMIIGYERGIIECLSLEDNSRVFITRLHKKAITGLIQTDDGFISSSKDGTICHYILGLNVVKHYYEGNTCCISSIGASKTHLLAATTDNTVKIWKIGEPKLIDSGVVFESRILSVHARGRTGLVFLNGNSYLVDLVTKEKTMFSNFKKIISVFQSDDYLGVLLPRKAIIYRVKEDMRLSVESQVEIDESVFAAGIVGCPASGECTAESGAMNGGISDHKNSGISDNKSISDYRAVYITRNNEIGIIGEKSAKTHHTSRILWMGRIDDRIYTVSKELLAIHRISSEDEYEDVPEEKKNPEQNAYASFDPNDLKRLTLDFVASAPLKHPLCAAIFNNQIVVGVNEGLVCYSTEFLEQTREIKMEKPYFIATHGRVCAVCTDDAVVFLDGSFAETSRFTCNDHIVFSRFSPDGSLFAFSCLDNKIYIHDYPSLSLRCSLYGHSLPVRHFSISSDCSLLVSCGSDKLVKIWGLQFGECRKSLLLDARAAEYYADDLFMASTAKELAYYRGTKHIKKYKCYDPGLIDYGTDYMVVTSGYGVALFSMNKYELIETSESEDDPDFVSLKTHSMDFYDYLDKLEESSTPESNRALYNLLERLDMAELENYLCILEARAVGLILQNISSFAGKNLILNTRVVLTLFKYHRSVCLSFPGFYGIQQRFKEGMLELRTTIGRNEAVLDMDINYGKIDIN